MLAGGRCDGYLLMFPFSDHPDAGVLYMHPPSREAWASVVEAARPPSVLTTTSADMRFTVHAAYDPTREDAKSGEPYIRCGDGIWRTPPLRAGAECS